MAHTDLDVSGTSYVKRRRPNRALLCVLILFLILIICLVIALATLVHRLQRQDNDKCKTSECAILTGEMLARMDLKADPCTDFYQYACGRYSKPENRPPDKSYMSTFSQPGETTSQQLAAILSTPGNEYKGRQSTAVGKVKQYYAVCMNDTADDAEGRKVLLDLIRSLKSWPLSKDPLSGIWDPNTWTLQGAIEEAQNFEFVPLLTIGQINDPRDPDKNLLGILASGLTLSEAQYYTLPTAEKAYTEYIETVLTLLYGPDNTALYKDYSQRIWSFEKSLAEISPSSLEALAVLNPSGVTTFAEAQTKIPFINLTALFNKVYNGTGKPITSSTEMLVGTNKYFESLNKLITDLGSQSKEVLASYVVWTSVQKVSALAGKSYKAALETLAYKLLRAMPSSAPKWRSCMEQSVETFGFAAGALYAEKYFEIEDRERITKFLKITVDEFVKGLPSVDWLQGETRKRAEEKARAVTWQIGYPEVFDDPTKLDNFFNDVTVRDSPLKNAIEFRRFLHIRSVRKYGEDVDRKEWMKMPTETNAYYYPPYNQIVVLGGILHQPMYNRNFPLSIFYGAMGSVLAHELLHGFDSTGRNYDSTGRVVDWWDEKSAQAYDKRAKCLQNQYKGLLFQGHPMNEELTLGENIADCGGVKLSYSAYTRASKAGGEGENDLLLPGLNMTAAQQFFLAYAQLWCVNVDDSTAGRLTVEDNHAPSPFRVTEVLKNTPQFSEAFKCAAQAPMNPKERCTLW